MNTNGILYKFEQFALLFIFVMSLASSFSSFEVTASPSSSYYYRFTVDQEGTTTAVINFQSTDPRGQSWVFVPNSWNNNPNVTSGTITQSSLVDTKEVVGESQYFYQAYKFTYQSSNIFNMTIEFSMDTGALVIEPRGIFLSPPIGFDYPTSSGRAEISFDSSLTVNSNNAIAIGDITYQPTLVSAHQVVFNLYEKQLRLQIEFTTNQAAEYTTLQSENKVFTFKAVRRYATYASSILNLYDRIYNNYTWLFNVTLESVSAQFFLPDFHTLLTVGGYTPVFTGGKLGEININIFFVRWINGTIEVIAAHELIHHFLSQAGLSPNDLLWFHEGMAQYASIEKIDDLGYEGAKNERERLEGGTSSLPQNFGYYLKIWNPSYEPTDIGILYVGAHYAVSELAKMHGGFSYYQRSFELIRNATWTIEDKNSILAYYLSKAANASVALTLNQWGFDIADLYTSSDIRELIDQAETTIGGLNPVFQPYRFLAEYLYKQALRSLERGNTQGAKSSLTLAISIAKLAPLLTLLTIVAILLILVYTLYRRSTKPEPTPVVPPPPPEIF